MKLPFGVYTVTVSGEHKEMAVAEPTARATTSASERLLRTVG